MESTSTFDKMMQFISSLDTNKLHVSIWKLWGRKSFFLTLIALFALLIEANAQNEFITVWKTDNPGPSEDNQITIPTSNFEEDTYDYSVDWGDGNTDTNVTGDITHTYAVSGTYTVAISGTFSRIYFSKPGASLRTDAQKLLDVVQWGTGQWTSMELAFERCTNLDITATDAPDLSLVNNMGDMFSGCTNLVGTSAFQNWDVSNVTDMSGMFRDTGNFNQDIGGWDVSNVINMSNMFQFARSFNQDIGGWDVSNVTFMGSMFSNALNFNQDIGNWDVGNVTAMSGMFFMYTGGASFDQNIGNWEVGKVINMANMFNGITLSSANYDALLSGWAAQTLQQGVRFNAGDSKFCDGGAARQSIIDSFDWEITDLGKAVLECNNTTSFVTVWRASSYGLPEDNQITIPTFPGETYSYMVNWGDGSPDTIETGDATHTYDMPGDYTVAISGTFPRIYFSIDNTTEEIYKILEVKQWGDNIWSSMEEAFVSCINLDVTATDIPNLSMVTSLQNMFLDCVSLVGTPAFNDWDVSKVTTMNGMFTDDEDFNQNIGSWDTSNVTDMEYLFYGVKAFNQNIGSWNVGKVNNMGLMFEGATNFNQDIGSWDVSSVTNMSQMFEGAASFNQDIGGWDVSNVTFMQGMFAGASSYNQDMSGWEVGNVTEISSMFAEAKSFNQDIGAWDVSKVTSLGDMFAGATNFNQNIKEWDVSNVIYMNGTFSRATNFNQDIGNWDVARVINMAGMFNGATSFNQDLSNWNVSKVKDMGYMFQNVKLSTENYDALLKGWATLTLQDDVTFEGGNSQYCDGSDARQYIIDTYNWTIEDARKSADCPLSKPLITTYNLIDADSDQVIQALTEGDYINVNNLPSRNLAIEVLTTGDVGSVLLKLSGAAGKTTTENNAPYSLFANRGTDYFGSKLPVGSYNLTGTPYAKANLSGGAGATLSINFELFELNGDAKLLLVNAVTDAVILPLTNGTRINKAKYPGVPFGVVFYSGSDAGGVSFGLGGPINQNSMERIAPYSLFANMGTDIYGRDFPVGNYILTAEPKHGDLVFANFEVFDTSGSAVDNTMMISPNPANETANITFTAPEHVMGIQIFDMMGRLVLRHNGDAVKNDTGYGMDVSRLQNGNYIVITQTDAGMNYQKQLIIRR